MAAAGGSWKGGNFVAAGDANEGQDFRAMGARRYEQLAPYEQMRWERMGGVEAFADNFVQQMNSIIAAAANYQRSRGA